MPFSSLPQPAFGEADLSNCEREQIHLAGSIQPHGALLVLREPDFEIVQASANAAAFLKLPADPLGLRLQDLPGDLAESLQPYLGDGLHELAVAVRCRVGDPAADFDGLAHRPPGGGLIIELERAGPSVDLSRHVETAMERVLSASTLRALCDEAADFFKELTGYDRVMVYRFDDEGHGEVFSEEREPELEAFLGNRYPASDIPQIARRLYERNRVRVLVDVNYEPEPLRPGASPLNGGQLDMSLCFLRSMSPIHIQYLKNMGVGATLVVSLMVGGRLWGLVACHHYSPRFVHYELRSVCELLAETVGTRIAALESFVKAQAELSVRRLEQRLVETIARDGDWKSALFDSAQALLRPVGASGAALFFEGEIMTAGEVPGTPELRAVRDWLDRVARSPVVHTASLRQDAPDLEKLTPLASGVLAAQISSSRGEYLAWFRPEQVRTVTWGGDPNKPLIIGDDPRDLSPRRSFAQWHQVVEGTAEPWSDADLTAARLIGETVMDVVLQFRSVRTLIAQDQLAQVSKQVQISSQPVVITDSAGRILLTNDAFKRLLPASVRRPGSIEELADCFQEPVKAARALHGLVQQGRPWRGEVHLAEAPEGSGPFMVRADPVHSTPQRLLGFVLLFTDLRERKAADAARRRFQEDIIEGHRRMTLRLDSKEDLLYRDLLNSMVGNAQLAALEITDGVEVSRMPQMLESIQASVRRAAELLEHLMWHATRRRAGKPPPSLEKQRGREKRR